MIRPVTNLLALLAAAMLSLQLPICVCASGSHSHTNADRPHSHPHDAVPAEHHEQSQHVGHSHDAGHSHEAGDHHAPMHAQPVSVPTSDGDRHDDSHPCQCSPQDVPVAPIPKGEQLDSPLRQLGQWMSQPAAMTGALPQHQVRVMTHGPTFWIGTNLLSSFQGNRCALLCRWVI